LPKQGRLKGEAPAVHQAPRRPRAVKVHKEGFEASGIRELFFPRQEINKRPPVRQRTALFWQRRLLGVLGER
jgi:hypothetical protein